jgi:NADH-quinone oxidoreductase subunit N
VNLPIKVDAPLGMIEPLLIVCCVGFVILLADLVLPQSKKHWSSYMAMIGVAWAFAISLGQWGQEERGYAGMVVLDNLSTIFNLLFLASTFVTILLSEPFLRKERVEQAEYYALLLFCTSGMMLLASALDLITLFLGIEVLSISLYVLAGYRRDSDASNEAAMKYFLLGAFASAILLYGVALVYGATATTNLGRIAEALTNAEGSFPAGLLLAGMAMILIGFAFKVALVPFHMWTPDVYEGAPTPITAFMSAGPKAAAFAAFLRTFFVAFGPIHGDWNMLLSVIAALTMTVGNVAAIAQTNVKRMLAYSSIAHSGYVLIGLVAGGNAGGTGAIFYLIAYTAMNLGAFAVVILLEHKGGGGDELRDYAGVGFRYPLIGAALSLFMISLSGIPPTVGFVGKLYLFGAAVQTGHIFLAVIAVLNSAVSIFYYLRLLVLMYMREPGEVLPPIRVPAAIGIALLVTAAATLGAGIFPGAWIEAAQAGVRALFS